MLHHRTTNPHERAWHCAERNTEEEALRRLSYASHYINVVALSMELQETYCREFAEAAEAAGGGEG